MPQLILKAYYSLDSDIIILTDLDQIHNPPEHQPPS